MIPLRVSWHQEQIQPYESLWGILNKFCRWNSVGFDEVWRLFSERSFSESSYKSVANSPRALVSPRWLDRGKVRSLLLLDGGQLDDALLGRYRCVHSLPEPDDWAGFGLQWCPDCMRSGYHSSVHNLAFVDRCPIHGTGLLTVCPECGRAISYSIPAKDAFSCSCGYPLTPTGNVQALSTDAANRLRDYVRWIDAIAVGEFGSRIGSEIAQADPGYNAVVSVYEDLRRRFVEWEANDRDPQRVLHRYSQADVTAAVQAWLIYWEGNDHRDQAASRAVHTRLRAILPISPVQVTPSVLRRSILGVFLGAFAECWDQRCGARACRPLKITGKLIPFTGVASDGKLLGLRWLRNSAQRRVAFECLDLTQFVADEPLAVT